MTTQNFTVDAGVEVTGSGNITGADGNITISTANGNAWSFASTGNLTAPGNVIMSTGGQIQGGIATVVNDGINSIALAPGAQMDVYAFPFDVSPTRGQLTITGDITTTQALGTWYYQSVNNNTYQLYTDSTYSTLVDASGWTAYTGGGSVAITKQVPAANIVINSNGFKSTFANDGQVILPGTLSLSGDIGTDGNLTAHDATFGGNINGAGNFDLDGNAQIGGNLFVTGNINFSGNVTQISGNSGVFFGNTLTGSGALYAGKTGFTPVANTILQVTGDLDDYIQVNLQNTNHANTASMELAITADDGDDTNNYLDMGIASSTWDGTQTNSLGTAVNPRDGYMYVQGGSTGGNLILGTTTAGYEIKFNAGGPGAANTIARIDNTGLISAGIVSATGNVRGGNINTAGMVSAVGNVVGNYIIGNGSLLTGLPGGYSNADVSTLLASFGSNTISTTGNITTTANIAGGNLTISGVTSLTGNITSSGYFISGNQATGGFKLGNVNSRILVGGSNAYMSLGPSLFISPDTSADPNSGLRIGGSGYIQAPNGARALTLGNDSNVAVTGSLNLPNGGQVVTTGNASFGNINSSASITRSGNYAQPAWTTSGIGLKMPTAVYTDTTTAAGNLATTYVHTMAAPTLSFTNAVNVANASTLFVSAPTAGTNATLGNAWAITASGSINTTANVVVDGNIYYTGISGSIRSLPGFAGAGSNGTWGVFDHNVPSGGYKNVVVGGGQTLSNSTTNIFLGAQYGSCNTTVYGNLVSANSASFSNTATITTSNYAIGYRDIPQITFSANANAALTDAGKHYYSTTAGNLALTLPDNSTTAFPTGTAMTIVVNAAGNVLVNAGTGVSLYLSGSSTPGNRVVGAYGMATVMKVAANVWFINGTGVS